MTDLTHEETEKRLASLKAELDNWTKDFDPPTERTFKQVELILEKLKEMNVCCTHISSYLNDESITVFFLRNGLHGDIEVFYDEENYFAGLCGHDKQGLWHDDVWEFDASALKDTILKIQKFINQWEPSTATKNLKRSIHSCMNLCTRLG